MKSKKFFAALVSVALMLSLVMGGAGSAFAAEAPVEEDEEIIDVVKDDADDEDLENDVDDSTADEGEEIDEDDEDLGEEEEIEEEDLEDKDLDEADETEEAGETEAEDEEKEQDKQEEETDKKKASEKQASDDKTAAKTAATIPTDSLQFGILSNDVPQGYNGIYDGMDMGNDDDFYWGMIGMTYSMIDDTYDHDAPTFMEAWVLAYRNTNDVPVAVDNLQILDEDGNDVSGNFLFDPVPWIINEHEDYVFDANYELVPGNYYEAYALRVVAGAYTVDGIYDFTVSVDYTTENSGGTIEYGLQLEVMGAGLPATNLYFAYAENDWGADYLMQEPVEAVIGQEVFIGLDVWPGYSFKEWTGTYANLLADRTASNTSFVMPDDVVIMVGTLDAVQIALSLSDYAIVGEPVLLVPSFTAPYYFGANGPFDTIGYYGTQFDLEWVYDDEVGSAIQLTPKQAGTFSVSYEAYNGTKIDSYPITVYAERPSTDGGDNSGEGDKGSIGSGSASGTALAVSGIPEGNTVKVGEKFTLVPEESDTRTGSDGWEWDEEMFSATFNSPATFTALKEGTSTITFTSAGGRVATVTITVQAKSSGGSSKTAIAQTGDASAAPLYVCMLAAALAVGGVLVYNKKKARNQ